MDVKSLFASQQYAASKPATEPKETKQAEISESFTNTFKDLVL